MSATTPIPGVIADAAPVQPVPDRPQRQSAALPAPEPPAPVVADEAVPEGDLDLRLIIEENEADGSLTYVTLDPRTGKVISRLPREAVLRMREAPDYRPGTLISTRG